MRRSRASSTTLKVCRTSALVWATSVPRSPSRRAGSAVPPPRPRPRCPRASADSGAAAPAGRSPPAWVTEPTWRGCRCPTPGPEPQLASATKPSVGHPGQRADHRGRARRRKRPGRLARRRNRRGPRGRRGPALRIQTHRHGPPHVGRLVRPTPHRTHPKARPPHTPRPARLSGISGQTNAGRSVRRPGERRVTFCCGRIFICSPLRRRLAMARSSRSRPTRRRPALPARSQRSRRFQGQHASPDRRVCPEPGRVAAPSRGRPHDVGPERERGELTSHEINFLQGPQAKVACERIHGVRIGRFVGAGLRGVAA